MTHKDIWIQLDYVHTHKLLVVNLVGLVQHHADLLVAVLEGRQRALELVADVKLVRVKQKEDQV